MNVEAKRMQQTKDKFFQIYQSFPDAVLVLRAGDSRVLDVNGAFEKLTGYGRDDIVGQTALQLVFFFDPDLWKKVFAELDARGEVLDLETRILRKNRTPAEVLISLRRTEISGESCDLIAIRDITERKRAEQAAKEREEQLKSGLDALAAPEKDISVEEVRQVIDFQALQELQNFFFKFTGFAMSIIDLKGNILVATGWQDICTKFHRIHPKTLRYCIECDTFLTRNVQEGKYLIYKCKNNMVDAVTPIIVEGKHIANLFSGQFFLEEDPPDRNVFIDQAAQYGYDAEEYLAALDKVPVWSRKAVENGMEFFARYAGLISKLSYRHIESARLLTEQQRVAKALRQSEDKSSRIFHFSPDAIFLMRVGDSAVLDVNPAFEKLTGYGRDEIIGQTVVQRFVSLFDSDLWEKTFSKLDARGEVRDIEARILRKDRTPAEVLISVRRVEIGGEPCNLTVLRDVTERKRAEKAAKEREEQLQAKLDTLLSPEKDVSTEEAGHIIDFQAIQELMNFFYKLTHIGMAIIDLKGNILVATGWQDICTKFHRVHPQTREYCNESDMYLSANVEEKQYKVYKCKNNMWDMATPINVGGKHIANLFLGQFFFEGEIPDYGVFVEQAKKYGFSQEYLAALEQVPRWSRETIDNVMQFYTRFAGMISKLSYRNIQLVRSLGEQKRLGDELRRSFDLVKQQATELAAEVVERRQAEEQLRFANAILQTQQETSLDGILVVDEGGKIISCNQRFVDMWNIPAEALESKSDERVLQSVLGRLVDPEGYLAKVKDLYEHRDKKSQDEATLIGGVTFERYSAPMLGSSGEYYGRVWYFRDITERRRAEAEVKKHRDHLEELVAGRTTELAVAKERAESANRAKSTFLANMSHELRTPLSAILGFSEMLAQSDRTNPDQREKLAIINRSGEHLLGMINEVLDLSKIEAGRVELEMIPFDLPRLLEDIGRMFEVRAKGAGLCFDLELGPELAPYIKADAGKLRQILINLLGNAVKFTQEGGFALRARTRPIRDDPARVELQLEVQDSGPGIPADQLERIFQPFTQLRPDHPGAKGTGLGLAISKSFMALMGGEIGVESAPGKGSLFRIDVPVELAEVDQIGGKASEPPTVARLADGQPAWRILAVEDNPANRLLLAGLLASAGFEVQQAENGAEAVARFRDWRPHLIWMDMRMPVMDGYEATRRIRALPGGGETKILALTASVFREEREEILQTGCDDVVHKPYKAREIFDAMGAWLGARYQYAAAAAAPRAMTEPEIRAAVAALPEAVKTSLVDAAQCADSEGFEESLQEVWRHDPPVTVPLRALAEEFRFDRILALLASGEQP